MTVTVLAGYRRFLAVPFIMLASLIVTCGVAQAGTQARARVEHAIAGAVKTVDHAASTIVVRLADGTEATVKFTAHTTVHGLKDVKSATDAAAKAGLEGGSVVIRYTGEGIERTAVAVEHVGKKALVVAKGSLVKVDEAGTFVTVKVAGGAEETFHFATRVVVDGAGGARDAGVATMRKLKHGVEVTVHYSEEGGRKLVHLVKHV